MKLQSDEFSPDTIVPRMLFLAYQASGVFGMGRLQVRDNMTERDVLINVLFAGDYFDNGPLPGWHPKGGLSADYVFGRMMKLTIRWTGDEIEVDDRRLDPEYQSWSTTYPTYRHLYDDALESLRRDAERAAAELPGPT